MMDELLEYINGNEHLKFIVSLDNGETEPTLYNCSEWGDLYSELGEFGNDPMILNGDDDLNDDGYPDHYIWNTFSPATTYSAYAFIDHNMVVRYMFDSPNLYNFQYDIIPSLLDDLYGCTDVNACNYDDYAGVDDGTCEYDDNCNNETSLVFADEVQLFQESANQKYPELVSTDDGALHLVWFRELGSNKNIMYSKSIDDGMTFSDPIQINQNSNSIVGYAQSGPKIKFRGNELLTIYMDHRSGLTNIYMNYSSDNGITWSEDILISDQSYLQAYTDFEVAPDGTIHLVYYSYNQNYSFNSVRYSMAQSGSLVFSPSIAVGITTDSQEPCDCCQPDLEISETGDIYLAYRNNIDNIRDTYIAIKPNGSNSFNQPIRASFHSDYNDHCPSSGPSIEIENNMIALSYRVSDAATSYIDYSDIAILSFNNAVSISSPEASSNFSDLILNEEYIHVGWIDYETDNPDVLYGVSQIGTGEIINIQRMNQNIEDGYIIQKDPKLHRHNDVLFYFWSDKRGTFYQLFYRKSTSNYLVGDLNYDDSVDILDIIILVNHILSPAAVELDGADINNDGEVNILDIIALVNIILSN